MKDKYSLIGVDGNAYAIMGYVIRAMNKERYSEDDKASYKALAMSSDYNNLLAVSMDAIHKLNSQPTLDSSE